jgi:hypothetical protein
MPTDHPQLWAALTAPFPAREIRQRKAERDKNDKKVFFYITPQSVKTRLDEVLGPENWRDRYFDQAGGVKCLLSLRMPDGRWTSREGAGAGKDYKATVSDSLKRAAESFGIGRHLKTDILPHYGTEASAPQSPARSAPALPRRPQAAPPAAPSDPPRTPQTGGELLLWARAERNRTGRQVYSWLEGRGRRKGYPEFIEQWTVAQVTESYNAAVVQLDKEGSKSNGVAAQA